MICRLLAYWRLHNVPILLVVAGMLFYFVCAYELDRADTIRLVSLYGALFFICFKLIQFEKWNLRFLLASGLLFRLIFLFALPNLSQDYFRFIWDGQLLLEGINPYLFSPDELIQQANPVVAPLGDLYQGMGSLSARNYSNYPPLNQLLFAIAALIGGKGVTGPLIVMRMMVLIADLGILYFGRKLLKKINKSPHLILWYFLNPLVIIELSGNLHFEGVMLFFFIWALYLTAQMRWFWPGILYGGSILLKLVPLLFLPLFLRYYGFRNSLKFYTVVAATLLLGVWPFMAGGAGGNYLNTLALWFSNFEFNAGLYNVIKEIGVYFDAKPWELIKSYGKISPLVTLLVVLLLTFLRKNKHPKVLLGSMLWALSCYYLLAPTVHPWYIISLVLLCVFTDFRFPLFWSAVVILSYAAYAHPDYEENMPLLALEYIVVIGMMLYEIIRYRGDYFAIRKN